MKWPSTNPKHLDVDFLSAEGAQNLSEGGLALDEELVQPEGGAKEVGEEAKEVVAQETDGHTECVSPKESIQKSEKTGKEGSYYHTSLLSKHILHCRHRTGYCPLLN